jgi:Flp pilus assembly protein TadG
MALGFRVRFDRFARNDDGAVLVEFALVFPVMLLFFAVIIESSRMMWSYQMAIEGVRDAGRYVARIAPVDVCSGGTMPDYSAMLKGIVESEIGANAIFPSQVTVNSVSQSVSCVPGSYRTSPAPVATVSADLTIAFPFGGIFGLFGASLSSVDTTVSDSARIFGQ